jgi:hypothetical protein
VRPLDVLNANEGDPSESDLDRIVFNLGKIDGIIHRSSMGVDGVDEDFAARCRKFAGRGFLWGAYHFIRQGEDPVMQARHFIETVKGTQVPSGRILLAIDAEYYGRNNANFPSIDAVLECAQEVYKLTGVYPGIYTGQAFLKEKFRAFGYTTEQKQFLSNTWLWIARGSPKRGNGLSVVNWWVARRAQFLCRRTSKALNLDLGSRCHSLSDSARHSSALFHDRGLE